MDRRSSSSASKAPIYTSRYPSEPSFPSRSTSGQSRQSRKGNLTQKDLTLSINQATFEALPARPQLPASIPAWKDALVGVRTDFTLLIDASRRDRNDSKTYFPDPRMFVEGSGTRAAQWFTIWRRVRPAFIFQVTTDISSATPLSFQEWRIFLFARCNAKMNELQPILSSTLAKHNISFDDLYAIPTGDMPDDNEYRQILWEMAEYNFRCDLLSLDRRIQQHPPTPGSNHEDLLAAALSTNTEAVGIFNFDQTSATSGLAARDRPLKLATLRSLCRLMQKWQGDRPPILEVTDESRRNDYIEELEKAIAKFFCQSFFNYFGRAPSIPYSLHSVST
ncbi:hypothetical protein BDN72DRAFT_906564 [Pluteus cervinus]|uniref:Uncharacterized protein n=1 Tax=Pluteus cervinus TaxID=181527 RepID=A0ACD2ZYH4_9AGAR|nr:hypothetical protein BDN72DRAFT_906564 [Pluteus cervinus]